MDDEEDDDDLVFSSEEEQSRPQRRRLGLAPSPSARMSARADPYHPFLLGGGSALSGTHPMSAPAQFTPRHFTTSRGFSATDRALRTALENNKTTMASEVAAAVAAAKGSKEMTAKEADDDVAVLVRD